MRLEGASYEEVARAGGGIVSTVKATRAADEDELVESALPRLDTLIAEGVTTIEVKAGYGRDIADSVTVHENTLREAVAWWRTGMEQCSDDAARRAARAPRPRSLPGSAKKP